MSAKVSSRIAAGVMAALVLSAGSAGAQTSEVASLKVAGQAPTSVKINTTGLQISVVRKLVRVAAGEVCDNAITNRQLDWADGDWCVGATLDRSMDKFRHLRAANARQVATGPEVLFIAAR